ncbi:DNA methyltransferase [Enterococcus faecalis]
MDTRLMQQIKDILKEFPQYWIGEELQRPVVIDDLKNYDALLISALLKNQKIRENYSVKAGDVVIFKVQEFIDILRYKDYWADSYTKYSNTIGLSSEGKYLQYNTDVVLDFPYKDCVLEGGMTKEDTGKEEVFYNEVIARDEIDALLSPKVLVNVKKYDADGKHTVDSFSNEDNLIIKGNNLLALHSLKERYAEKVKFIYIDVPYNTKNDSFRYNDRFNHSSWLTFIRNRLLISRELLSDTGIIALHCDDNEIGYVTVLLDELFGRDNLISIFPRITKKGGKSTDIIAKNHDYILLYSKKDVSKILYPMRHNDENFKFKDEYFDSRGYYKLNQTLDYDSLQYNKSLDYEIKIKDFLLVPGGNQEMYKKRISGEFNRADWAWRWSKDLYEFGLKNGFIELKTSGTRPRIYTKTYQKVKIEKINGQYEIVSKIRTKPLSTLEFTENKYSNDNATKHANTLIEKGLFDYTKPESLICKLIELNTKENDIVLDFFMGSATTQSVAMKMNRRFIGIEQMDYINTVSVPRLQKVIEGEQGGISKDVNWQGGGSFIYAELMELNQLYMNKIDQVSTKEELADLWDELDNNADLNFQLDKEKLVNELLKEHDEEEGSVTFNDLTFDEQKAIFKKALDKNQLYVPYSEIEDTNVLISDSDKSFNYSFYNGEVE